MTKTPLLGAIALLSFSLAAQTPAPVDPVQADVNAPEFALTEKGCQGARVLDHLDRHGDFGAIDAEALLYLTRIERDRWLFDARPGKLQANAINGEVWQSLGPTNGAGRAIAVALHPTTTGTAIVGTAGGGAWKTTTYGAAWTSLTDSLANLSVGAVTFAPSDPNRVYLGTGEGGYAIDFIPGIGFLSSNDGGQTWSLPQSVVASMFYRILVHPTNPNDVIIGTNAGALRSTDGGTTWQTIIQGLATTTVPNGYGDVTDIVRDPSDPAVLYAATWDRSRWCAGRTCNFPNVFVSPTVLKSTDGGATWSPAASGLPTSTAKLQVERFSIAIAPSNPNVLYLLTATRDVDAAVTTSRIYKTTSGGASWTETTLSSNSDSQIRLLLGTQGWYDNTIVVNPKDANMAIAGGVRYTRTTDGGLTWSRALASGVHVDAHDLRYDTAGFLWVANDGGVWTSPDNGSTATARNTGLVTRQYYAMSHSALRRERILGGTQDNGTNIRNDGGGTSWGSFTGGDGFQCLINQDAPGVEYSTIQFSSIQRTTSGSTPSPIVTNFSPPFTATEDTPFFSILQADPNNPSTIYTVSTRVWKSATGGDGWMPLSQKVNGTSTWTSGTVRALTIARSDSRIIVISKGNVLYRTTDGGESWSLISVGLPTGRTFTNVEIHPQDANTMFVTVGGTAGPSVYLSTDAGTTWTQSANGLPSFSALVIRYDVTDPSVLYVGTDVGVYRSTDHGANWSRFGTGLPAVSVYDLQMFPDGSVLRAATHGRGIWELRAAPSGNRAPSVAISTPGPEPIERGTTMTLEGTTSDADGDAFSARWTFPDDWSTEPGSGSTRLTHTFDRAGVWSVALTATDAKGARTVEEITVPVLERGDDCSNPIAIPASGPFPWSITLNTETGTRQQTDTPVGGSCYQFTPSRTFWFSFTPEETASYSLSLCGSRVAGFVATYSGAACGPYTEVSLCSANTAPTLDCAKDPAGTMTLTAGTTYRFQVAPYFSLNYGELTFTVNRGSASPTVVRAVSPSYGSSDGGTLVVITGTKFDANTKVRFGGEPASNVTFVNPTLITATAPSHAPGTVDVAIESEAGTVTVSGGFTYRKAPSVTGPRRRSARH